MQLRKQIFVVGICLAWLVLAIGKPPATAVAPTSPPVVVEPEVEPFVAVVEPAKPYGQQIAEMRADYMARNNYRGHPPRSAGDQWSVAGAKFEGVGWNSSQTIAPNRIGTCRPSGRSGSADDNSRRLLGDAVSTSRYGSFRVRIWGR